MIDRVKFGVMPSIEKLYECFTLDANLGILIWNPRPIHHFKNLNAMNRFNTLFSGKVAGCVCGSGYTLVSIDNRLHKLHRLIYLMHHGICDMRVDHIDGNRTNNSISNLRLVSKEQHQWNKGIGKTNKSGVKGVSWRESHNAWYAQCGFNGVNHQFGYFNTIEEAEAVVREFRSKAHREFANHGDIHA